MIYSFKESIFTEGRGALIRIPFNVWEALDYHGISYGPKAVYPRGGTNPLPPCCIVGNDNRFLLWYQGSFCGVSHVDPKKTISYIEVFTE